MSRLRERDPLLESLRQELHAAMAELNRQLHPVYPGTPEAVTQLEAQIEDIKAAIAERRAALGAQ